MLCQLNTYRFSKQLTDDEIHQIERLFNSTYVREYWQDETVEEKTQRVWVMVMTPFRRVELSMSSSM